MLRARRSKPSIAKRALERVPTIEILTDPEEISDKALKGRAGRYQGESRTLFVNGLYPIVERMSVELGQEPEGAGEPEVVRAVPQGGAAGNRVPHRQGHLLRHQQEAVRRLVGGRSRTGDLPESLSMAADGYKQGLPVAGKWARDMVKLSKVEKVEAA